jgi:hypothetical protein
METQPAREAQPYRHTTAERMMLAYVVAVMAALFIADALVLAGWRP